MGPLWITKPQSGSMTKKYGVSFNCCHKLVIFGKTVG
jgi:hypothetical protein